MSDSSTNVAPKTESAAKASPNTPPNTPPSTPKAPKNPAGAQTGGSRLGWLVAGFVIVLAGGAIGWGALYGKLPAETRASLPAFLQSPGASAGGEIDDKMAAFDLEVDAAMNRLQAAANHAAEQQGARLTHVEGELRTVQEATGRIALGLEAVQRDIKGLMSSDWVSPEDLERLAGKISTLEGALALQAQSNQQTYKLAADATALARAALDAGADAPRRTAFAVALSALDRAAATGRPFGAELAAAKAQADEDFALKLMPLAEHAPYGVDTLRTLTSQFEGLARSAMKVDAIPATAPWYEKIWARLKSIITVRPVGEVAGTSTGAILSRAEAQLGRGDLDEAVTTLQQLDGAAALTFDKWLRRAQDRLAVDAAVKDISLLAQTKSMGLVATPAAPAAPDAPTEPETPELVEEDIL